MTTTKIKCSRPACNEVAESEYEVQQFLKNDNYDSQKRPFCSYRCGRLTRSAEERRSKKVMDDTQRKLLKKLGFTKRESYGSGAEQYSIGNGVWLKACEESYGTAPHYAVQYPTIDADCEVNSRTSEEFTIEKDRIDAAFAAAYVFAIERAKSNVYAAAKDLQAPLDAEKTALCDLRDKAADKRTYAKNYFDAERKSQTGDPRILSVLADQMRQFDELINSIDKRLNNELKPHESPVLEAVAAGQRGPRYERTFSDLVARTEYLEKKYSA